MEVLNHNKLKRSRSDYEIEVSSDLDSINSDVFSILSSINENSSNKKSYRDFNIRGDFENVIPYVRKYIQYFNKIDNDQIHESLAKYWSYFKVFLPVAFNIPGEYMDKEDDEYIKNLMKGDILFPIVSEKSSYEDQLGELNRIVIYISYIVKFIEIHKKTSFWKNDKFDIELIKFIRLYSESVNELITEDYNVETYAYEAELSSLWDDVENII